MKRNQIINLLIKNEGKKVYAIDEETLAVYSVDLTRCRFNEESLVLEFEATYVESLFSISGVEANINYFWHIDSDEEEFFESIEELKKSEYCEEVKRRFFECFTRRTL